MTDTPSHRSPLALDVIYYLSAIVSSIYLFYYYWTSAGGPVLLAMTMVPVMFVLFTLQQLRANEFYPKLPIGLNYL
ncbi:MAG TPA: hypothetical protein VE197_02480, partial [Mycobacterium sp.]|nr:hypothetical protein [Mycobacterium sp.]